MGMTEKRLAFCREYLEDGDGKAAAIRAGYAPRNAKSTASKLLTMPEIREELDRLRMEAEEAAIATHAECCIALSEIIRANLARFLTPVGGVRLEEMDSRAVQELTIETGPDGSVREKLKLRDPIRAVQMLARLRGYEHEIKVKHAGTVEHRYRFVLPDADEVDPDDAL